MREQGAHVPQPRDRVKGSPLVVMYHFCNPARDQVHSVGGRHPVRRRRTLFSLPFSMGMSSTTFWHAAAEYGLLQDQKALEPGSGTIGCFVFARALIARDVKDHCNEAIFR